MKRIGWALAGLLFTTSGRAAEPDIVTLPPVPVPFSHHASPEAAAAFAVQMATPSENWMARPIAEARAHYDAIDAQRVALMRKTYKVEIARGMIGSVPIETVTPADGVSARNRGRVLINLHGGSFLYGAAHGGEVESIPIAALGKITVVTVDYRMAPEHHFPAASEDVETVYRALLKTHAAGAIGIYGCSAGGVLTGESVAWLHDKHLPRPGAIGTFCGSISQTGGDSFYIGSALTGHVPGKASHPLTASSNGYLAGASDEDPLVVPAVSPEQVAAFPPTLLITGTRDFAMSNVIQSQRILADAGVDAELHMWDGMWHGFFMDPTLPESREAYRVITSFFDRKLAAPGH